MKQRVSVLPTAEQRRPTVIASAIRQFACGSYFGATVAQIADDAKISAAYFFKLFPSKESLFVAALDRCFELVEQALADGADAASDQSPSGILYSMGGTYAELIADRSVLMMQVHAQSAADIHEIGDALRRGVASVTTFAKQRSGASNSGVQRFIAFG